MEARLTAPAVLLASGQRLHPAGWGGAETTAHDLLVALARRGSRVRAIGACPPGDLPILARRLAGRADAAPDAGGLVRYDVGYPVEIAVGVPFAEAVRGALARERFDLVVVQALGWPEAVRAAREAGVRSALYVHGLEVLRIEAGGVEPDLVLFNSSWTRAWLAGRLPWRGEVLHPPVDLSRHRTTGAGPGGALTLFNPVPPKGVDLFLELAALLPDRRFLAVEGWVLPPFIARRLARAANVELVAWREDVRPVLERTGVLLVPSEFEPFGRVAVEAAASGIPAVTSGAGGLPEATGDGAIHVPVEAGPAAWIDAIARVETDHETWAARARLHAGRFDAARAAERFLELQDGTPRRAQRSS